MVTKAVNGGANACTFADQAAAQTAFNAWLATASVSGGCSPSSTPSTTTAPSFCGGSVEVTWTIADKCYAGSSYSATYTITAPDVLSIQAPVNVSEFGCDYADQESVNTAFAAFLKGFSISGGCDPKIILSGAPVAPQLCDGGEVRVTFDITDKCYSSSVSRTFSIAKRAVLNVASPADLVVKCDQDKVALFAQWIAGFANSGGCSDSIVTDLSQFTLPTPGVPLVIEYVVKSNCETVSRTSTFLVEFCDPHCTYTQGYYGNSGGKACADGVSYSTTGLISKALSSYADGKMIIGLDGHSVWMTNTTTDINKIIEVLPGGGSSAVLLAGNKQITALPATYLKKGSINNTLLAQTITLGLNLGIDNSLGSFSLKAGTLATAAPQGGCGSKIPMTRSCSFDIYTPTINEYKYFNIPAVVNLLPVKTIQGLFDMANKALGGGALPNGVTLSNIADAVDVINNAFDGCRISMGYDQTPLTCVADRAAFIIHPVPVVDYATVTYKFSYASTVTIEVRSLSANGTLVYTQTDPTPSYLDKEVLVNFNFNTGTPQIYFIKIITNIGQSQREILSH